MTKVTGIVRIGLVGEIIHTIEEAGCRCLSVVDICGLGDLLDPERERISFEYEGYYMKMSRIEVLCRDEDVQTLVEIFKRYGHTNHPGDGVVYVSPVERAAKIRSGEEGEGVFQPS